jgi:hypothetical protein
VSWIVIVHDFGIVIHHGHNNTAEQGAHDGAIGDDALDRQLI